MIKILIYSNINISNKLYLNLTKMKNDKNEYSSNSILLWIAENFTPIDKIEQASTGVLYCEIINRIYPNSINMNKLNYGKSLSYDQILKNYKILQDAFKKIKLIKILKLIS